jgi:threonine/homoserine/homoserine lactone efflux protein
MPEPSTSALFALGALAVVAIRGPNLIYVVTRSIDQGRRARLASALGVERATLVHVAAAAVGLSAALASSATVFSFVQYAGAAYLLYLGVRTLAARGATSHSDARTRAPAGCVVAEGFLVNLLNPKLARSSPACRGSSARTPGRPGRRRTGGVYIALAAAALTGSRRGS